MSDRLRLVLAGPFVPYTRMTQRSKWTDRAQRYLSSQGALRDQARAQMNRLDVEMLPESTPLAVAIEITMTERLHCQDLDNQTKAVLDALQGVAFKDDRWVDDIWAMRQLGDVDRIAVEFCIKKP